jgi:uncharacterized membrane protein
MKKFWEINPRQVAQGLIGGLIVTDVLIGLVQWPGWWPFKLLLFGCLTFLPGIALLRILRETFNNFSIGIVYSFGLSVLVLMLSGLAASQLLYAAGVARPLEFLGVFGVWNAITATLIAVGIYRNVQPVRMAKRYARQLSKSVYVLIGVSLVLPVLAALGALELNNGGDASLAMVTLGSMTALIVYMFLKRQSLPDELIAWLIFSIGLTILLMTSLRGFDIVGHDIQREFRVYTLTHMFEHWDVARDRDPYNACLSITILPEMFTKLLGTSGLAVFKVILQIVFAACPAVLYVLLRQYVSRLGAITGSMLFICYPTFINDSAMLTRQGVAYLFFALALLVMTLRLQTWPYKILFLLCSLGSVLSHYSTAYMFVALFGLGAVIKLGVNWWLSRRQLVQGRPRRTVLSPMFAGLLFLMTFTWYTQITATSSGLTTTLSQSFARIPELFTNDNKSSDTSTALLFSSGKSQIELYEDYLLDPHLSTKENGRLPVAAKYIPILTSDDLPLTSLGEKAYSIGIDPSLIAEMRQNFAKILQVLALAGVLYAAYRLLWGKPGSTGRDFVCLSLASLVLLALLVVLPVLSVNYGILRAFQQALIFLLLPIVLLLIAATRRMHRRVKTVAGSTGIVFLFLLFTGMFAQLLGGTSPSLSMNNSGLYFGLYYSSEADSRSFSWMKKHIPATGDVRAANFNRAFMHDPMYPFHRAGIIPSQTGPRTFVYLDPAQIVRQRLYTYHDSSPLIMTFPLDYYEGTKNRIYSTGSTGVYR